MSGYLSHTIAFFLTIVIAIISCTPGTSTQNPQSGQSSSIWSRTAKVRHLYAARSKKSFAGSRSLERRFDFDKDGILSRYEAGLMRTHLLFGWELADSKRKKKYDLDRDHLLNPMEFARYHKDKDDAGRIKGKIFVGPSSHKNK